MTPREAVMLTTVIQAYFPQQPISEYTPDALHELLEPYTLADCKAAVVARAMRLQQTEGTKWCAPTDVYAEVRRARHKAIADDVIPMPADLDPDDTAAYIRVIEAGRKALAEGRELPQPEGLTRRNLRELGGPVRRVNELPDEQVAPSLSLARQAAEAARIEAQANAKPEPEPLLREDEYSREPEPPETGDAA